MTAQRVDVNILDGLTLSSMAAIHTASSLGTAEIDPVPSFVAGPLKLGAIDQGLEQQRTIPLHTFPIFRQAMSGKRKGHDCKSLDGDPGQHKEPALIDDKLKIAFSFLRAPSYPGGAGKLQAGEIAARQLTGFDEVAKAGAHRNAVFQVMVTVGSLNQRQNEWREIACTSGDSGPGARVARRPELSGKSAALFVLDLPRRPFPLEKLADGLGQFRQAQIGEIADNPTDEFKLGYGEKSGRKKRSAMAAGRVTSSAFVTLSEKKENVPREMQLFKNISHAGRRSRFG